jgi:hypothetical protein
MIRAELGQYQPGEAGTRHELAKRGADRFKREPGVELWHIGDRAIHAIDHVDIEMNQEAAGLPFDVSECIRCSGRFPAAHR